MIVPVVLVNATVAAFTVLLNVVPPEFVMVIVPILVPTAPVTETVPSVLNVTLALPVTGPETLLKLIAFEMPVPKVSVTASAKVAAPNVI